MFIVTGASSGIGRAVAVALADRGVDVVAVARRAALLQELQRQHGDKLRPVTADLATAAGVDTLAAVAATYERVDGIVHAAGSQIPPGEYAELLPDDLAMHFRIHVTAPIEINSRLRERLAGARLIYTDSYSATALRVGWSGYSIIKSAAQMATRAAREELEEVQVIRIFPGGVRTPLVQAIIDSPTPSPTRETFRELDVAGELAEPEAIGSYIAGIALEADDEQLASREFWDYGDPTSHVWAGDTDDA